MASFATSYIPTTSSQVTRSADAASMTGTNFSSWYRQGEGSVFLEADNYSVGGNRVFVSFNDNTLNNRLRVYTNAGVGTDSIRILSTVNGVSGSEITGGAASGTFKTAAAFALNDFAIAVGGFAAVTDTSSEAVPNATQMLIGIGMSGTSTQLSGVIRKIAYYPLRLPNATLQAITA